MYEALTAAYNEANARANEQNKEYTVCAVTGKVCPFPTNEYGGKPCHGECEIGKEFLKDYTPLHDEI